MARYDVVKHGNRGDIVVDIQANSLDHLSTRVAVPLLPISFAPKPARFLNPIFFVNGREYSFMAQYMSAIPKQELGEPIANLDAHFDQISRAIDMVFQGF